MGPNDTMRKGSRPKANCSGLSWRSARTSSENSCSYCPGIDLGSFTSPHQGGPVFYLTPDVNPLVRSNKWDALPRGPRGGHRFYLAEFSSIYRVLIDFCWSDSEPFSLLSGPEKVEYNFIGRTKRLCLSAAGL